MSKTRQQKKEIVDNVAEKIKRAKFLIFTSFSQRGKRGLNFAAMEKLKKNLKEASAEYMVLKKTLLNLALEKFSLSREVKAEELSGSVAVLFGYGDLTEAIKILHKLSKENEALVYFFGLTPNDKKVVPKDLLVELANLPSREILLQRLAAVIHFPIWSLANALQQVISNK